MTEGGARKGAIFDVDGTLLDSMPIWEEAPARWLLQKGVTPCGDLAKDLFKMSLREGAAYMKESYGLAESLDEIIDGVTGVIRTYYELEVPAKPGAAGFVRELRDRGIPMLLATSSVKEYVRAALSRIGIWDCFDGIITSDEAGAGKTDPQIYLLAARKLGLPPGDIFVFEDVIHAVRTANRAGFITVGVYDRASEADNAAMRKECAIYLHELTDLNGFLRNDRHGQMW